MSGHIKSKAYGNLTKKFVFKFCDRRRIHIYYPIPPPKRREKKNPIKVCN